MFIGQDNQVSHSLVETIGKFFPGDFIVLQQDWEQQFDEVKQPPAIVFVNLMDANRPQEIARKVRKHFPNAYLTGIHTYDSKVLIDQILTQGYDHYLTVFKLNEELPRLLQSTTTS